MIDKIKIPLKITLLTPLHIGSGKELVVGQDMLIKNSKALIFSFDKILQEFSHDKMILGRLSKIIADRKSIDEVIPENQILKFVKYRVSLRKSLAPPSSVKEFIKDIYLKPYIPGTSIKGGIRTLIFQRYVRDNPKVFTNFKKEISRFIQTGNKSNKKDIENFEKEVFGKDAKMDPLKSLSVNDAYLEIKDLNVYTSKVFDISNDGEKCGWRKSKGRDSEIGEISNATPIFLEAIKDGSTGNAEIYIDNFYLNKVGFNKWFVDLFSNPYKNLSEISVEYSLKEIDKEVDFLSKFVKECKELRAVVGFLNKKLKKEIENDPEAIYLRIAWGIGWKGMTGDYMDEGTVRALLNSKIIKQGRLRATIFPKTRRFVVLLIDGKEYPCFPFGWIKLKRLNYD